MTYLMPPPGVDAAEYNEQYGNHTRHMGGKTYRTVTVFIRVTEERTSRTLKPYLLSATEPGQEVAEEGYTTDRCGRMFNARRQGVRPRVARSARSRRSRRRRTTRRRGEAVRWSWLTHRVHRSS